MRRWQGQIGGSPSTSRLNLEGDVEWIVEGDLSPSPLIEQPPKPPCRGCHYGARAVSIQSHFQQGFRHRSSLVPLTRTSSKRSYCRKELLLVLRCMLHSPSDTPNGPPDVGSITARHAVLASQGQFFEPTVLADVTESMLIAQEESENEHAGSNLWKRMN